MIALTVLWGPCPQRRVMVLRIILGAVYTAMAAGQLASSRRMPQLLDSTTHDRPPRCRGWPVVWWSVVGVLSVVPARPRSQALAPVWAYTGVSVVCVALGVQVYLRGLPVDNCGCSGRI